MSLHGPSPLEPPPIVNCRSQAKPSIRIFKQRSDKKKSKKLETPSFFFLSLPFCDERWLVASGENARIDARPNAI